MSAFPAQPADLALQLIARTGAQHQAAQQVEVAGLFRRFENLRLQYLHFLVQAQHALTLHRKPCATPATPARAAFDQRLAGQVVEFIDRIPGRLVADAGSLGRAGDRALFGNMLEQGDTLRATGDVLGEEGGQGHGGAYRELTRQACPGFAVRARQYTSILRAPA